VLAEAITNMLRAQLQRFQCSYIVEQPVHPAALKLLILHAVYRGPERRDLDRTGGRRRETEHCQKKPGNFLISWQNVSHK
jgi:hypothetical protein